MKRVLLIFIAVIPSLLIAQDSGRYVDYGLLRTQGNLAFGIPLNRNATDMYFAGDVDYYVKDNVSINGGIFYYVGQNGGEDYFNKNHSLFAGMAYHFKTSNKLDPYVGFQPGLSLTQLNLIGGEEAETSINPLFSVNTGVNYFANRFFNVFVNVKYQTGKHYSEVSAKSLSELKLTLGLGYMLWARKGYCKFRKPSSMSDEDKLGYF